MHQQEETSSRKKKTKVEVELAAAVAKYDRDMAGKTAQIDEIKVRSRQGRAALAGVPGSVKTWGGKRVWAPDGLFSTVVCFLRAVRMDVVTSWNGFWEDT